MKLVEKKYLLPFVVITVLFALWGFANDITNPMVAAFQTLMELPAAKASLIQFAFYGGYATMAIPAALFIRRYSYKRGILLGLALYAVGTFLFIPAAARQSFTFFCFSLYILTFGLAFLETTANPFILSLGAILIVGKAGLYSLVGISLFMSLMFPTIYGTALEKVSLSDASLGAAFLVMAIVGGALMPPLQGAIIDQGTILGHPAVNVSYALPLLCFVIVTIYGLRARKYNQ